ncbi:MAG TPA: hypothetical protein VJN18_05685 [Polyangiaceae bacterium]|nr:hypothetical protein [Polyangiaceae bacterium]
MGEDEERPVAELTSVEYSARMRQQKLSTICLLSSVGILISSFFAFASTSDGEMFVSVTHIGGMAYMIPLLGVVSVVLAILGASGKLNFRIGATTIGLVTLFMGAFTAYQAMQQLDLFATRRHEFATRRAAFERDFNSSLRNQLLDNREEPVSDEPSHAVVLSLGTYLCLFSALVQTSAGLLMDKDAKPAA